MEVAHTEKFHTHCSVTTKTAPLKLHVVQILLLRWASDITDKKLFSKIVLFWYYKHFNRYYQPKRLAGGLKLVGGGDYASGIFGMDFSQPAYRFPSGSFQLDITFSFKKSVFFAGHVIICLGTGISSSNSSPNITQVLYDLNSLLLIEQGSQIIQTHISTILLRSREGGRFKLSIWVFNVIYIYKYTTDCFY